MLSKYPILRLQNDFLRFLQVNYPQELEGQSIACAVLSVCCKSSGLLFTTMDYEFSWSCFGKTNDFRMNIAII